MVRCVARRKSFAESEKGCWRDLGEEISQQEKKQAPLQDETPRGATRQVQADAQSEVFGRKALLD
jgi:hypothetical protein